MGWSYCGVNSATGDEMGYSVTGVCHQPDCGTEIDHGLSYVCGGMHEGGDHGCGRYFCSKHLFFTGTPGTGQLCGECLKALEAGQPDR